MTTRRPRPPGSPPPSTGTPRPRSGPRWRSSHTSSGSPRWADTEYHHHHLAAWLQKTVIYSGAGISVAAGLGQAARSSGDPDGDPQVEHYLPASLRSVMVIRSWCAAAGSRQRGTRRPRPRSATRPWSASTAAASWQPGSSRTMTASRRRWPLQSEGDV